MKSAVLAIAVVVAASALAAQAGGCPSYESAVNVCLNVTKMEVPNAKCRFWGCVYQFCDAPYVKQTFESKCAGLQLTHGVGHPWSPLPTGVPVKNTPSVRGKLGTPETASPCGGGHGSTDVNAIRHWLLDTGMDGYYDRASEHYTEGPQRWSGITGKVCPPKAPPYSDCSAFVTWIYWTLFGNGPDFINNEKWQAGYTGTMDQLGVNVGTAEADLAIGDLCFYYHPIGHTTMYVGNGMCVSHGEDPLQYIPYTAIQPLTECRRYI